MNKTKTESVAIFSVVSTKYGLKKATKEASCFDIKVRLKGKDDESVDIEYYDTFNVKRTVRTYEGLTLEPNYRYKVPTGLFTSFINNTLEVYSRSGKQLKLGLVLISPPNIIDSDYNEEVFVLLHNISSVPLVIMDMESVAQCKLSKDVTVRMFDLSSNNFIFNDTTDVERKGGFGHTDEIKDSADLEPII